MDKLSEELRDEALNLVQNEVTTHKDGEVFITENVAIATRQLIRVLRKNYWGIFDVRKDPVTGKDKFWVPLSRLVADSVRKNADMDFKDIRFRANKRKGIGITSLVRGFVRTKLYNAFFGETLNDSLLQMCIDGTVVWKSYKVKEDGKTVVKRKTIDVLNTFIDPTAESIQDANLFTERSLLTPMEVKAMTGWMDTDVKPATGLHRAEMDMRTVASTGAFVDVYETWGLIPERLITGKKDDDALVHGHIVVSGLETGDKKVHLIEKNTTKDKNGQIVKPYEEARYIKVPNRWAGVGPVEMVMNLQEWINTIVNLRINKNTNASLGLFKVKAGAGITQQMLSNLISRGVIKLNNMDDLDNFAITEAGESSYRDEEVAKQWAFDITSTYDIARGAPTPASATATSAVIEDRNSKTAFVLVREAMGLFLQRYFDRHYLPHVPKMMKEEGAATLYSDFEDIDELRERVVAYLTMEKLGPMLDAGQVPPEQELMMAMDEAAARLRKDKDLFLSIVEDILTDGIDTVAQFTNEETDTAVTVKNLIDMSQLVPPDAQRDFVMQALDLLGLDIPESLRKPAPQPTDPSMQPQGVPSGFQAPATEQELVTAANTV